MTVPLPRYEHHTCRTPRPESPRHDHRSAPAVGWLASIQSPPPAHNQRHDASAPAAPSTLRRVNAAFPIRIDDHGLAQASGHPAALYRPTENHHSSSSAAPEAPKMDARAPREVISRVDKG